MSSEKVIIWDLGGTLIKHNPLTMVRELGSLDFLIYRLFHRSAVRDLKTLLYNVLFRIPGDQQVLAVRDGDGTVVPPIISEWLAGKKTGEHVLEQALSVVTELDSIGYFANVRERRLLISLLRTVMIPSIFVRTLIPIDDAMHLLEQCGNQHTMMIGSNLNAESFDHIYRDATFAPIFNYIPRNRAIVSGSIGINKPDKAFFDYILQTYHLTTNQCVFIDDQQDNVNAAEELGIVSFHLKQDDKNAYRDLQKKLHVQGILQTS